MDDIIKILTSIGIGAITAAVITFIGNMYIGAIRFNRENTKFLIEKRIAAYNEIEKIIIALDEKIIYKDSSGKVLFHGYRVLTKVANIETHCNYVLELFSKYSYYKIWLSSEMNNCLTEIFNELIILNGRLDNSKAPIFIQNNEVTVNRLNSLIEISLHTYYSDALKIKDIKKFIKNKTV